MALHLIDFLSLLAVCELHLEPGGDVAFLSTSWFEPARLHLHPHCHVFSKNLIHWKLIVQSREVTALQQLCVS